MIRELFEVSDAYEQNEIRLTKDVTQWKDNLKVKTDKVEELNKQLSEVKTQKETIKFKCLELETITSGLVQNVEQAQALNETQKKSLQVAQADLLSVGDETFERAKSQVLCLMPSLNVSEMDFVKTWMTDLWIWRKLLLKLRF